MYFWACWFDRRYRLIVYLALAVALAVLATLPAGLERHEGRWVMARITSPAQAISIWQTGIGNTLVALLVALLFIAADLGVLGWGDDPERTNLDIRKSRFVRSGSSPHPRTPRSAAINSKATSSATRVLPIPVCQILMACAGEVIRAMTHRPSCRSKPAGRVASTAKATAKAK